MKSKRLSFVFTLCAAMFSFVVSGCQDLNPLLGNNQTNQSQNNQNQNNNNNDDDENTTGGNSGSHSTLTIDTGYRGDYYNTIDPNSSTLLNDLHNLVSPKLCKTAYGAIWNYLPYSDAANPDGNDSLVLAYYRGTTGNKGSMNKEHVWPKSHGGNKVEGDPHVIRPTFNSDNSSRGNEFYVQGKDGSNGWDPANFGVEQYRGDAARIILYCAVRDLDLKLVDMDSHPTTNNNRDNMMGKLSDLLKWNLEYPVSEREKLRNDVLSGTRTSHGKKFDFNRNPFIDHPEYACKIWGNTNAATKEICKDYL